MVAVTQEPAPLVLAVDDEPLLLRMVARMLEDEGYRVLTAGSALEALDVLAAADTAPDVVLTDVRMNPIDGVSLAILVRHAYPGRSIVLMSGYPGSGELAERLLRKPFTVEQLVAAITDAVSAGRARGPGDRDAEPGSGR